MSFGGGEVAPQVGSNNSTPSRGVAHRIEVCFCYHTLKAPSWQLPFRALLLHGHLAGHSEIPAAENFFTDPVMLGVSKANIPEAPTSTICFPF